MCTLLIHALVMLSASQVSVEVIRTQVDNLTPTECRSWERRIRAIPGKQARCVGEGCPARVIGG